MTTSQIIRIHERAHARRASHARRAAHAALDRVDSQPYDQHGNWLHVANTLTCDCTPYLDVFTRGRWLARGYRIRDGACGITIPSESTRITVYCRCQIDGVGQ